MRYPSAGRSLKGSISRMCGNTPLPASARQCVARKRSGPTGISSIGGSHTISGVPAPCCWNTATTGAMSLARMSAVHASMRDQSSCLAPRPLMTPVSCMSLLHLDGTR